LRRIGQRADVTHVTAHRFRRTFCLWALRNGMDLLTLSRIMGHADIHMVKRYAAQLTEDLQTAHRQYSPVDNLASKGR